MQALILAAGMGRRLKELTANNTKCQIRVNGVTLIERMLKQLDEKRLTRIVIVVGYEGKKLVDFIGGLSVKTPIVTVWNRDYSTTNNVYSLYLAREWLTREDTLLLESDLIVEDAVIEKALSAPEDTLAVVDRYESWMDGTCVTVNEESEIERFVPKDHFRFEEIRQYYKTVNIYRFGRDFSRDYYVPFLEAYSKALGANEYYEQVLRVITLLDEVKIRALKLAGERWYEIDDVQDLDIAQSMFSPKQEKPDLLTKRYGGYWRYPRLLDFCYLVNPYFPPKRLTDEIKANFETLLSAYPSGQRVNSLLAAKDFGVQQEEIVVGNGASELIRVLMELIPGRLGVIRPSFEEYANRRAKDEVEEWWPDDPGFRYTAEDVCEYFTAHPVDLLVLINPDNPSGNCLTREEVEYLLSWAKEQGIRLILDESFLDFAGEETTTCINSAVLRENPSLVVVKSISKACGVPGLRLGVAASGDRELIKRLKEETAIWNINSFAEYYLQIAEKYEGDFSEAMKRFRIERDRFRKEAETIEDLRIYPTGANFFLARLLKGNARGLAADLLDRHQILIKDLTGKIPKERGEFLRIAIRDQKENDRLLRALKKELN